MSGGETAKATKQRKVQHKKRRPHFHRQREKVLRGNDDPLAAVFSWGVSHHQRELSVIPQPKMLLADDFKAYSKLKVENHAFNRASLPGHYKVKEYCPLVFRALRERFDIPEEDYTESLSLHHIEPLITQDEIEKLEESTDGKIPGKLRKRDILRSYCGRFTVSLISTEDIEQLHNVLASYYAHIVEQKGETLLPNWLGLYRVGISNRSDRYLLVTRSVTHRIEVLQEVYRLKGNIKVEKHSEKKQKKDKKDDKDQKDTHLKDVDWLSSGRKLILATEDAERFKAYLEKDVALLQRLKLMNYSLDIRFLPANIDDDEKDDENHDSGHDGANDGSGGDHDSDEDSEEEDDEDDPEREPLNFRYKTENNGVVYLAINDILNHYDTKKKAQNAVKSAKHGHDEDKKTINPDKYGKQFFDFISKQTVPE